METSVDSVALNLTPFLSRETEAQSKDLPGAGGGHSE